MNEHCDACGRPTPDHICRCRIHAIEADAGEPPQERVSYADTVAMLHEAA